MATNVSSPEKDTDCIALTDTERKALEARASQAIGGCWLIGIDGAGAIHYWDYVDQQIAVFDSVSDTDPTVINLRQLPIESTLRAWARQTVAERDGRGWMDLRLSLEAQAELEADR